MTNSTFEEPKHPETGDPYFLSTRTIPPEERLILALDVPSVDEARALVERLDDAVQFYKVGLELLGTGGYFELIEWLVGRGKKVFADLKLFDVPETVRSAMRQLRNISALPWVVRHVAVMPDVHYGKGATVGSVIAMRDAVSPAAVGVDIGCGMTAVRTSLTAEDLPDGLGRLRRALESAVPVGFGQLKATAWDARDAAD